MRAPLRMVFGLAAVAAFQMSGAVSPAVAAPGGGASGSGHGAEQVDRIHVIATVNVAQLARQGSAPSARAQHLSVTHAQGPRRGTASAATAPAAAAFGGDGAPPSTVVSGGDDGNFNGISSIDMEGGGTGSYAGTNGSLEPPDQGLCTGAGFVIEAVNDALRVYTTAGVPATPKSIPLAQFFARAAGGITGPTDFISDPRCLFDHATQRWFVTILDLTSVPTYPSFSQDQNFIAVSKTSDPTGSWNILSFDVTDNGMNGSPLHAGCVGPPLGTPSLVGCLGDQPTIGADANGIYITDNEYAFAEVFPVAPPVGVPLQQIPVLRGGVAQLYALSKQQLVTGTDTTLVRFDTNSIAFPGPAEDSPWQSVSPAQPAAGDTTPPTPGGVEYFLSDVGLPVGHSSNQLVVWAWTGTDTLNGASPTLLLQSVTINTANSSDTFFAPDPAAPSSQPFGAYQKDGPHPLAAASGDPEEELNANDDRVAWVVLSNGTLWTGVNTLLSPSATATGHTTDDRVGIMYFQVSASMVAGKLQANMARDGYVQVPNNNVLFPSIGARVDGATVMTFTLAGVDHFPSLAWARLDGVPSGQGPVVHIARAGAAPEDGFTGLGLAGSQGLGLPDVPPCGPCVARWGDYSASQVDENGCIWGSAEYIPTGTHDALGATDWGTGIYHVCPAAVAAVVVPEAPVGLTMPLAGLGAALVLTTARRRRRLHGPR